MKYRYLTGVLLIIVTISCSSKNLITKTLVQEGAGLVIQVKSVQTHGNYYSQKRTVNMNDQFISLDVEITNTGEDIGEKDCNIWGNLLVLGDKSKKDFRLVKLPAMIEAENTVPALIKSIFMSIIGKGPDYCEGIKKGEVFARRFVYVVPYNLDPYMYTVSMAMSRVVMNQSNDKPGKETGKNVKETVDEILLKKWNSFSNKDQISVKLKNE